MPKNVEKHDKSFWKNIVELEKSGKKLSFLISEYDISRASFYYWKKILSSEEPSNENQEDELKRLRKERARLELENEILKKAVMIIGKNS